MNVVFLFMLNVTSSSSVEVPSYVSFRLLPFRLRYCDWLDCCFPFFKLDDTSPSLVEVLGYANFVIPPI